MMMKVILLAAAFSFVVCAGASAFPTPKSQINPPSSDLVLVGKKYYGKKHGYKDGHYKHHAYKHPPKGWRSYSYRPYRWEHRGCIAIGPGWYCP